MSADNYLLVRHHPSGEGFTYTMEFDSSVMWSHMHPQFRDYPQFGSPMEAYRAAVESGEYTEYAPRFHPEVLDGL